MASENDIYESDPEMRPDSDFVPGRLGLLAVENKGRLLDPRRTPVAVVDVTPERGSFTVQVEAFEDAGAKWELFLAEAGRFQFERDSRRATGTDLARMTEALARFDRPFRVEPDPQQRETSLDEIRLRRRQLAPRVAELGLAAELIDGAVEDRLGSPSAFDLTEALLAEHQLTSLERDLLLPLISNPRSGEMVKGHAIVLAELGLCPFEGRVVRDPDLFDGWGSKDARQEHLLWRMALTQEMWANVRDRLVYRVVSSDETIGPSTSSFVSTTFSEAIAKSHVAAGAARRSTRLMTRALPLDRLFVTFLETRAMNEPFREAEALLVAGLDGAL